MRTHALALLLCLSLALPANTASKFDLTIDNIMRGPNLVGYEPAQVRWSGDSAKIYFQWKRSADPIGKPLDTYVVDRNGGNLRKLSDAEEKLAPPLIGDRAREHDRTVYAREGDIFIYEHATGKTRQITKTSDSETNPRFTRDSKHIAFTRSNNLFVLSLEDGSLTQMTDIQTAAAAPGAATPAATPLGRGLGGGGRGGASGAPAEEVKGTDSQEYLKKEEKELLAVIRERAARRMEDEAKKKRENPRKPFKPTARQTVAGMQLSPDEKFVTVTLTERADRAKTTIVPNFVTESAYTEDIPSRDKVGDQQTQIKLVSLSVETGEAKFADANLKKAGPKGEVDRELQLGQPLWSEDGTKAVISARAADNKDRWLLAFDPATGKTRMLVNLHDDAWVGGPGAFTLGWMKNDREVYFQSEKTGYSHLYSVPFEGGDPRPLTQGKWEVTGATLTQDKQHFILTTSESDPGEHKLYEMPSEGGARALLAKASGNHAGTISPDGEWLADIYSYSNRPPELFVQRAKAGAEAKKLTDSPAPEFHQYPWLDVPILTFATRDGAQLRAKLYKPANYKKGGPAVVFVHGSGYLQDIHKGWSSSYYHEYMFHHILMEHGYLVFEVDYRGSAGYGRDWRTGIYEHMGGKDLDDHIDAAKWLVANQGVDAKRIGIYGGSYGGFITLMAMFTTPDTFAAGAALRPVTDWAHYNNGYTSDILNAPQDDPTAYKKSSPIYFAAGLKGALLICHGMVDTNVHFQDTVRLSQKLIELRKSNWELAAYPAENHGFVEPTSWADEYSRILALFERNLKK